jgi:hypothetical protein
MVTINVYTGFSLFSACFLLALPAYGAGSVGYGTSVPTQTSTPAQCRYYEKMEVARPDSKLTITCTNDTGKPSIVYDPASPTWCEQYDQLAINPHNQVTIACSALFSIRAEQASVSVGQAAPFTATRLLDTSATQTTLTLSTAAGQFTNAAGTAEASGKIEFKSGGPLSEKFFVKFNTASSNATVTAAPLAGIKIAPQTASIRVDAKTDCPTPTWPVYTHNMGNLPIQSMTLVVPGFDHQKRFVVEKEQILAIKFTLPNTHPPLNGYGLSFTESIPPEANRVKELAIHACPGIFTVTNPACYKETFSRTEGIDIYTQSKAGACVGNLGQTYFLNIKHRAKGTLDDPYEAMRFMFIVTS